jgi:hypothetical protein
VLAGLVMFGSVEYLNVYVVALFSGLTRPLSTADEPVTDDAAWVET